MKNLFVPYELALKLKEKGFNELCMARYDRTDSTNLSTDESNRTLKLFVRCDPKESFSWTICVAPLYQQVVDWFREKHVYIDIRLGMRDKLLYKGEIYTTKDTYKSNIRLTEYVDSYYEALTKAIEEALKLIP